MTFVMDHLSFRDCHGMVGDDSETLFWVQPRQHLQKTGVIGVVSAPRPPIVNWAVLI